jgi:CubicO group peptidase (beta-lactamase class C family)
MKRAAALALAAAAALAAAGPAAAAKSCAEPGPTSKGWEHAAPADVGMDAAKLQDAVNYAATQASYSLRVYRHGCLVAADANYEHTSESHFESWSMAKSIVSMVFGRAMTLGLVSADDPVGSLIPEADQAHGQITLRNLLTMTSGLHWNGFRDYDIAMEDRLRDFLTVGIDHKPGTWFEYSQTGPFTLAEAISRAVGEDFQDFAQRELFGPIGIVAGTWRWVRDGKGRTQGFYGMNMRPDDFGRLGDLMRRGGVWKGKRLLSKAYLRNAIAPTPTNGCYGWLIWLNEAQPCISPTVSSRPVKDERDFPALPADLYRFSGLFGQLVSVFPGQDVIVVRTGQDPGAVNFAGGAGWEETLYTKVLGAITDQKVPVPGDAPKVPGDAGQENPDNGFQYSFSDTEQYSAPFRDEQPPAAGPFRQRALILRTALRRGKQVRVRALCPKVASRPCAGTAKLTGARRALRYEIAPGASRRLTFTLRRPRAKLRVVAVNADAAGGARSAMTFSG